jgi:hypothetical protein
VFSGCVKYGAVSNIAQGWGFERAESLNPLVQTIQIFIGQYNLTPSPPRFASNACVSR